MSQENMSEERKYCENQDCFCRGFGPQAKAFAGHLWSQATCDHFRNSRIEFLKGLRSLIDHRIERLSRHAEPKGTSVPVD
jgi:hypothetical protein